MRYSILLPVLILATACASETVTLDSPRTETATSKASTNMSTTATGFYNLSTSTLEGAPIDLSEYAGQVTLVVNVASECGYTPQYSGLQELHDELASRGFSVLGFPSNEFGGQEPGSAEAIREFCTSRFDVSFPMFAKCEVKSGAGQSPLFSFLEEGTGETPNWNFCKYLVGKDGKVIAFYKSGVTPDAAELRKAIEAAFG